MSEKNMRDRNIKDFLIEFINLNIVSLETDQFVKKIKTIFNDQPLYLTILTRSIIELLKNKYRK